MELHQYLFKNKTTQLEMAKKLGIQPYALSKYVNKKTSPSLWVASLIVKFTKGKVSFEELISTKDAQKFKKRMKKI